MYKKFRLSALILCVALCGNLCVWANAWTVSELPLPLWTSEKKQLNEDTVGWLWVPGTDISRVVLQNPEDKFFYLRRDFNKKVDSKGSYFADYRCKFDSGNLSRNTIIYGNSSSDDPNGEFFGQLNRFRDAEFAKQHPYIYFSTTDKTMAWRVFAVSIMDVGFPYNNPEWEEAQLEKIIARIRANSLHEFSGVKAGAQDKLLTLSTVDYSQSSGNYRLVIMAKLVESN